MLGELRITGLGVIDDAVIRPAAGLTVVTGETGAGKTMVVTALGLVCGGRADSGRVRGDARKAVVEARFVGDGVGTAGSSDETRARESAAYLASAADAVGGDVDDDGSLLIVRSVSQDGRSRAHLGGRSAPVSALAEVTEPLVAVHGQSEAQSLLKPETQRAVLDRFAGVERELTAYRELREEWLAVRADISDRQTRARERAQREQVLRLGLDEIAAADPQPGEDADLVAEVRRLNDVDALRQAAGSAVHALAGPVDVSAANDDEPSATGLVQEAIHALEASSDPDLAARIDDLRSAAAVIADVAAELTSYLEGLDADPERLETALARQAVLRTLVRRYGEDIDAVLTWARDATAELQDLDDSEDALAALRRRVDDLESRLARAAAALTAERRRAAARMSESATAQLADLAMGNAAVRIAVTPRIATEATHDRITVDGRTVVAGPDGTDHIETLLTPHPTAPETPVSKGASGGELSRVMLALEVVLADADPVVTLVFDEVDAGVGGRAATEIGRKLAMLARDHQVIVVTHLAQVAAFADTHYVVDADAEGTVGISAVRRVDGDARTAELARMLGGTDGNAARAHAADLLDSARTPDAVG